MLSCHSEAAGYATPRTAAVKQHDCCAAGHACTTDGSSFLTALAAAYSIQIMVAILQCICFDNTAFAQQVMLIRLMAVCGYRPLPAAMHGNRHSLFIQGYPDSLPCSDHCEPCPGSALQRQARPEYTPGLLPWPPPDLWRPSGGPTLQRTTTVYMSACHALM